MIDIYYSNRFIEPFSGDWLGSTYLLVNKEKKFNLKSENDNYPVHLFLFSYISEETLSHGLIEFKEYELESMMKKEYIIKIKIHESKMCELILLGI